MAASVASLLLLAGTALAQQSVWGQCGGQGYSGPTSCAAGSACSTQNAYYAQCIPGTAPPSQSTSKPASPPSSSSGSISSSHTVTSSAPATSGTGLTQLAGINIAGFDFGCTTDGSCDLTQTDPPTGAANGIGQMQHFVNDDKLNIFRLPVAWQYLVDNDLGGTVSASALSAYDQLVNGCLATGAYCIVDIHNYARWNGAIIGQGGPTNAQFTSLWSQLAAHYASEAKVWFGVMNEPHDLTVSTWGQTVQAAVTAIRGAGATSQYISLPGSDYQSAGSFLSDGSSTALEAITNPDGTTTGLIFDVHKYLDSDNSGTSTECVTNNIDDAFEPLAAWLRSNGRKAILSETGGGNTASCEEYVCQELQYLDQNSDVYMGYVTWAAGSFIQTYALVETPTNNGGTWTDTALVQACIAR